jgi:hypothetical protein
VPRNNRGLAFELAVRLFVRTLAFSGGDLPFGQQNAVLRHLGFEGLEAVFRSSTSDPGACHTQRTAAAEIDKPRRLIRFRKPTTTVRLG